MATPEHILGTLTDALARRTRWDEKPGLYTLTDQRRGRSTKLRELRLPDALWAATPPALVPFVLAAGGVTAPPTVLGVALRFESFTITNETGPQARDAMDRRSHGLPAPSNADIPGRQEERCIMALLRSGDQFIVSAHRTPSGTALPSARQHYGPADPGRLTGGIVTGLTAFLA